MSTQKIPIVPEIKDTYKRIEVEIPLFAYVNAAFNVEVDVATITLTPGTWVLGYDVNVFLRNFSGANLGMAGRVRYTDSDNNFIFKTAAWASSASSMANNEFIYQSVSRQTEVTVTETTTFKLRLTSSVDAVTNEVAVAGANVTGAVDGADNNSTLWAERKRLIA